LVKLVQTSCRSTDDNAIVLYEWYQVSGPRASVVDRNNPQLALRGLREGTYVFELAVTDKAGQNDTDRVVISVLAGQFQTSIYEQALDIAIVMEIVV